MPNQFVVAQRLTEFRISTDLLIGANAASEIGNVMRKIKTGDKGDKKVLVVTDKGVLKTGIISAICTILKSSELSFEVFDQLDANPTDQWVAQAFDCLTDRAC